MDRMFFISVVVLGMLSSVSFGEITLIDEGFETGDFSSLPWQHSGDADWVIVSDIKQAGLYSAKSGTISDGQTSALEFTQELAVPGTIRFAFKISSQTGSDYFQFYMDGVLKGSAAGEVAYTFAEFPVTPGVHTFKWIDTKDAGGSAGGDCAWLDTITIYGKYSGGLGTSDYPYQIATKADLLALAATTADYNKCFILTADIDMTGETFTKAVIASSTTTNLAYNGTKFTGKFNGNDHIISNLHISSSNSYIGLFGYVGSGGQISDLGLENVDITGSYHHIAGLCGYNYHGTISQCYTQGTVTGNYPRVGGLCGYNNSGTISQSYSTATVTGSGGGSTEVGGLCGYNDSGTISGCYATGAVTGIADVGGLCGATTSGTISQSYATGNVEGIATGTSEGAGDNVGGLCGSSSYSPGTISQCYATGAVKGRSSVGGLCGYNYQHTISQSYSTGTVKGSSYAAGGLCGSHISGTISQCYSTGMVTGISYVGGLCGDNYLGTITDSFWDTESSGRATSAGGTGKMTAEMKTLSTFTDAGWDFTNETINGTSDYWRMCFNDVDYPRLSWQATAEDIACPIGVNIDDLDALIQRWLMANCTWANNFCGRADMDQSGTVNLADFAILAQHWLEGV